MRIRQRMGRPTESQAELAARYSQSLHAMTDIIEVVRAEFGTEPKGHVITALGRDNREYATEAYIPIPAIVLPERKVTIVQGAGKRKQLERPIGLHIALKYAVPNYPMAPRLPTGDPYPAYVLDELPCPQQVVFGAEAIVEPDDCPEQYQRAVHTVGGLALRGTSIDGYARRYPWTETIPPWRNEAGWNALTYIPADELAYYSLRRHADDLSRFNSIIADAAAALGDHELNPRPAMLVADPLPTAESA